MKIKKNDNVLVITGKDRGKKGKVRFAYPEKQKLLVEGVNLIKKHPKAPRRRPAGRHHRPRGALDVSNVMFICTKCNKPARVGFRKLEDGRRVQVLPRLRRGD